MQQLEKLNCTVKFTDYFVNLRLSTAFVAVSENVQKARILPFCSIYSSATRALQHYIDLFRPMYKHLYLSSSLKEFLRVFLFMLVSTFSEVLTKGEAEKLLLLVNNRYT